MRQFVLSDTRVGQCVIFIPNDDDSNFICPEPRGPTELLKNAKNRFKIGFSYFQEGDTNRPKSFGLHLQERSCLF